ncbi:hypothetical protein COS46_02990 [Candidatus Jorgensenbacteria bacterium CG03_land_8_20_14_0_80_38_39]|uniref:Uncharacterized protein n=1 Tax=Candidatus Jorgensenbacteria bacterium CG11_big_fil_rev_8_21_14_0_20_38_23 TaxID=1974594 RepID=A0A2H0NF80_9BACT|nr:MAG: hypothetical protein COV54_00440 [Candidatus Jorgensenbacteria bacterium CG11_big_fil_rev_8_21_14_0_20_38_23]PIV12924.1 MAG: hypothetical protein COS46_02990 [Candidatus Jorgensenbacteria bacterium CG03_land_8_20_14_0_80_38_39]
MKKKYFWGGAIIILGLLGASFIVLTSSKNKSPSLNEIKISDYNSDFFQFERKPIAPPLPLGVNPLDNEKNLTENLAKIYAQKLVKRNPNGPVNNNNQSQITVPSQNLAQEVLLDKLNQKFSFPQFSRADLKINEDNSLLGQQQYVKNLWVISQKNFRDSLNPDSNIRKVIFNFIDQKDSRDLQNYINVLALQIKDVKDLAVPSSWETFHLQALNLWQKEYTILSSILNMDSDSLKTILASQELINISQEESDLGVIFIQHLKDLTYKK